MSLYSVTLFQSVSWTRAIRANSEEEAEAMAYKLWEDLGEFAFTRRYSELMDVWSEPIAESFNGGRS